MRIKYKAVGIGVVVIAVLIVAAIYLHGSNVAVLNPRGPVALKERNLIITATLLMLIVVLPVFFLLFFIAWKYRADNVKATYTPDWDGSRKVETIWWLIPSALILALSVLTWQSTHQLDPYRPLVSSNPGMTIQVVAMDWKWLFLYPQQHIASVNYLQIPVNTPVEFQLTADAPMNSFWIPQLGGQIYAMPGMATKLNLMASSTGSFRGSSANISGDGFAGMHFITKATSETAFQKWATTVQHSDNILTASSYRTLAQPSKNVSPKTFNLEAADIYDSVIAKYDGPGSMSGMGQMDMAGAESQ